MNGLPKGWINTQIGQVITLNEKLKGIDDEIECGFVPMALMPTAYRGFVNFETKTWGSCKKGFTQFKDGDVLLAKITPCFENGKGGIVTGLPNGIGAGSTEYFVLRCIDELIQPQYLHAFVKSKKFMDDCEVHMGGSVGHKRVPKDYLLKYEMPLAPLNEQIRIANKLDSILAKVDKAQARLDKIPAILKRFRQSVLAAATSGELTKEWREDNNTSKVVIDNLDTENDAYDIWKRTTTLEQPANWTYCKLSQIGKVQGGGTPRKSTDEYWDGDIPWVTPKDMKRDFIKESQLMITKLGVSESSAKMIDSNSILFVVRGMILAHSFPVALNLCGVTVNQDMKCITPAKFIDSKYLLYILKSQKDLFVELASSSTHGTKRLEAKIYNNVAIPICPMEEQVEIVRIIENLLAKANKVEKQYLDAKARLDRLTQSILAKAFRGELVAQDPNDEPADKLLERIVAEKEQNKSKKTTRKRTTKAKTVEKE
ncbi:TPA: restriction endonuclease subunit S [Photobacterium damselae]